jgi:transglutaminase-like putative cysteine protease
VIAGSRLARSVLACILLALAAFAVAEDSLLVGVVSFAVASAGWWFNERARVGRTRRPLAMARWLSTSLLALSVIAAVLRGWLEHDVISSFLWLLASVLLLKTWEDRRPRDYGQLVTVSVFLGIGATLSDNSLPLGLLLAALAPTVVFAAMECQLLIAADRAGLTHLEAMPLESRRSMRRIGLACMVAGVLASVGTFLLVPRGIGLRRFGEFAQAGLGRATGFVEEVDLGRGGLISESQSRVLDVTLTEPSGRKIWEDRSPLYLRGAILDSYTGREWKRSRNDDDVRLVLKRLTPGSPEADLTYNTRFRVEPDARSVVQHVVMKQATRGDTTLFSLWRPRHIRVPGGTDLELDLVTARLVNKGEGGRLEYEILSTPSLPRDSVTFPTRRGDLPPQSDRVVEIAQRVIRSAGLEPDASLRAPEFDPAVVDLLVSYVQGACKYTLDVPTPPLKSDPIEYFLLDSKQGNCELFAASLASLCRAAGIDARVIAGYMASEFDSSSATYIVRQSDAHAWCEVEVSRGKWEPRDPTPPSTMEAMRTRNDSLIGRLGQFFADLRDRWNQNVVTFDATSQQRLLGVPERDQPWYAGFAEAVTRGISPGEYRARTVLRRSLVLLAWLAAGLASVALASWAVRWWLSKPRAGTPIKPGWGLGRGRLIRTLSRELDAAFTRLGTPRPAWRPPGLHAPLAASAREHERQLLTRAARCLYEKSFSEASSKAARDPDVTTLIADLRRVAR